MAKASKRRHCPALGRGITPADCGEDRNRRITCPADCVFNPFNPANYDQLLEIEHRMDDRAVSRLELELKDAPALLREHEEIALVGGSLAKNAFMLKAFYYLRDASGLTFAQRWQQAGLTELRNDARVVLAAKAQMRFVVLEVRRVIDEQTLEVVDLLVPGAEPLCLVDRSLAALAVRFDVAFTWIFPLPAFWRVAGSAMPVPNLHGPAPVEIAMATLHHLGAPLGAGAEELSLWSTENAERIVDSFRATQLERISRRLAAADFRICSADYALAGTEEECVAALQTEPEAARTALSENDRRDGFTATWTWYDDARSAAAGPTPGCRARRRPAGFRRRWRSSICPRMLFARSGCAILICSMT